MLKHIYLIILLLQMSLVVFSQDFKTTVNNREKLNINRGWKFKLGDYSDAEGESYNDKDWSNINLPHNFSIPYFQSVNWYTGFGWYRKYIEIPEQWKSKRIFIEFEAAFREAQIFINGQQVGTHKGGYTGFSIDITDKLKVGKNVLAVRLNNNYNPRLAPRNGDHNFIGGIYRDVYLVVTNQVHVTWYGTFVTTPALSKKSGVVNIKTEIRNDGNSTKKYTVRTDIVSPSGKIVTSVTSKQQIPSDSTIVFDQTTPSVIQPKLWHPDHPFMYKAISTVMDDKVIVDKHETSFGFRWTKWSADSGFFLNGEHYYFKGANVHQDHAGWANAVTNAATLRDVRMIKDCGMDFIRGSHYPHDPSFSDACDNLGVLLWQENDFWGSGGTQKETDNWYEGGGAYPAKEEDQPKFEESVKNNLREMVRIHRNHPSIIAWSMCNEPFFTDWGITMPQVREFLKELTKLTHELDPTRKVGIGGSQRGEIDKLGDIAGYNGDGARLYINPGIPSVVTEYGSTIAKRPGDYNPGWGELQQEKYPWRSGEAIWCAFDYGTRAGDFGLMGMIDYFRLPKNMWYWYRNEYKHISPPEPATNGTPLKLKLTADKMVIANTNGTDDIFLVVSVLDKDGKQLSNSPDVTLEIVSGPGEFPTGTSITFSEASDIYIRDGKAAIEFRSYFGGKTIIKATSAGLQNDSVVVETKGSPVFVKEITPKIVDRPYTRYIIKKESADNLVNIAYQKPTRASSEMNGKTADKANDKDTVSFWQPNTNDPVKWWQVDLENIYTISEVKVLFPSIETGLYKIELSIDNKNWETIASLKEGDKNKKYQRHQTDSSIAGRFLRIKFIGSEVNLVSIREVEIFGKTKSN
ncbi:MAG: glycoside hydrolase family 2 TIM barrel-domain containing protein [Ferruginibacter sp.]